MGYWNYRVLMRQDPTEGETYEVHEVYYDEDGEISTWTERPTKVGEGSAECLKKTLEHMINALDKPVLREVQLDGKVRLIPLESGMPLPTPEQPICPLGQATISNGISAVYELERTKYDEFLALWSGGGVDKQRLGQAFYNYLNLHKLSNQYSLGQLYELDGQQALKAIEKLFHIR